MKINISKTDVFMNNIDTVVESLFERKDDLCSARKMLVINSPTADSIINHISDTEKNIDEVVYKLLMLKNAAARISEAFLNAERLLEIKAEARNVKKVQMYHGLIHIEAPDSYGELMING